MAEQLLAAAYYLLLLAGSVSLGKAIVSIAKPGSRFDDEKTTGLAAVVGGAVVVFSLGADFTYSGWNAFSTASGILVFAIAVSSAIAAGAVKLFFANAIASPPPEELSSAMERAELEEKRAREAQERSKQASVDKPVEKLPEQPQSDERRQLPPGIGEVIKLGSEKPLEKKEEKKQEKSGDDFQEVKWDG